MLGHADASRPAPVVAFANRAFLTLTGLGREAIVGRTARTLRNLLRPRPVLDDLLRAVASGERFEAKVELTRRARPPGAADADRCPAAAALRALPRVAADPARRGGTHRAGRGHAAARRADAGIVLRAERGRRLPAAAGLGRPAAGRADRLHARRAARAGRLLRARRRGRPGGAAAPQPAPARRPAGGRALQAEAQGRHAGLRARHRPPRVGAGRRGGAHPGRRRRPLGRAGRGPGAADRRARGPARGRGARRVRRAARRAGSDPLDRRDRRQRAGGAAARQCRPEPGGAAARPGAAGLARLARGGGGAQGAGPLPLHLDGGRGRGRPDSRAGERPGRSSGTGGSTTRQRPAAAASSRS